MHAPVRSGNLVPLEGNNEIGEQGVNGTHFAYGVNCRGRETVLDMWHTPCDVCDAQASAAKCAPA